ncbi:MAG: YegS/Rv2252/BmrU family lipid kinase [Clostridia bacterium]|nr:YegS/Rv2252/BmrU family lipid kinase [Clostridia bacterium]
MKKGILIYNPLSGGQRVSHELDSILGRFQDNGMLVQPYRIINDKNLQLIDILKSGSLDFAIVSGGDGTLNSVVNLLLKNNITLPLGIIPSGTCNDFARCLNIPSDIEECIEIVAAGATADVDVGLINEDQYFLSTCAGGNFVDVSFNTHSELKKNFGPFAYYLKAISEMANIKTFKIKIQTDNEIIEEKIILFLILNGKDAAGFRNVIKEADISDGIMDIVLVKKCSRINMASLLLKVLSNDSLNNKDVTLIRTKSCTIEGSNSIILSIDGEKGIGLPISVRFINKALKVFKK